MPSITLISTTTLQLTLLTLCNLTMATALATTTAVKKDIETYNNTVNKFPSTHTELDTTTKAMTTAHNHRAAIEEIQQTLDKPTAMSGSFEQKKQLAILKLPLRSSGDFIVSQQQGIIWQVRKPTASELIITPNAVHFSEHVSNNVEHSMRYIAKILNTILSGDMDHLQQQFDVTNSQIDSNKQWELQLKPKSLLIQKALNSITLSGSNTITGIVLHETKGDSTTIQLHVNKQYQVLPEKFSHRFIAITDQVR